MFKCPNCNQHTISKSSKFWIGPVHTVECSNCNAKLSVPFVSLFIVSLYVWMMYLIPRLDIKLIYTLLLFVITVVVFFVIHYKFVPLEIRLKPTDRGYKKQRISNISIAIIYFVITMGGISMLV